MSGRIARPAWLTATGGRLRHVEHGLRPTERPWIAPRDAGLALELPALALASYLLPRRRWNDLCRAIERTWRIVPGRHAAIARGIDGFHRGLATAPAEPPALALAIAAARREHWIEVLHAWCPRTRAPGRVGPTRLDGGAILDAALARGRGAVLWVAHFAFAPLASKVALAAAGYRVWHVSRPEHGFSTTRFGIAVLNPIRWRVEERYLAGRLIIDRRNPAAVMLKARRLLARNALVSITAGDWEGARVLEVPFGGATLGLSSGAPALAHLAGAPLLPMITTRPAPGAPTEVSVGPPIDPDRGLARPAWVDAAATDFVARFRPFVERRPEQWRDWSRLRVGAHRLGDGEADADGT